jgi:hypothetical protein
MTSTQASQDKHNPEEDSLGTFDNHVNDLASLAFEIPLGFSVVGAEVKCFDKVIVYVGGDVTLCEVL